MNLNLLQSLPSFSSAVDMWAVGCIAYELKRGAGKTPFEKHDPSKWGVYRVGIESVHRFVRNEKLRDFVLRCLEHDPTKRLWATAAMKHRLVQVK